MNSFWSWYDRQESEGQFGIDLILAIFAVAFIAIGWAYCFACALLIVVSHMIYNIQQRAILNGRVMYVKRYQTQERS